MLKAGPFDRLRAGPRVLNVEPEVAVEVRGPHRGAEDLAQGVEQVPVVPDEGAFQQFAAAGVDPAFHDRVHARYA